MAGRVPVVVSKKYPGQMLVGSGANAVKVEVKNVRDAVVYDTVEILAAAVTEGQELNFFRDITNKDKIDTNITTSRRLATGEQMKVLWVGIYFPTFTGNTRAHYLDILRVLDNGFLELKLNKKLVAEGPLWMFPTGYGAYGTIAAENASSAPATPTNQYGVITNGLPATKLQYRLREPADIYSEHDISGKVTFYGRNWLTAASFTEMPTLTTALTVKMVLGGLIAGVE